MNNLDEKCARCQRDPAEGYATIDDKRYCHGTSSPPSCYMLTSWNRSFRKTAELVHELQEKADGSLSRFLATEVYGVELWE